jgi:uncharacterized RDD family membrane protein YckC
VAPDDKARPGQADAAAGEDGYPGQRFGLPETGPRSVAGLGSRVVALLVDWVLCEALALGAFHNQYLTIVVFAIETWLLTALTGFTVGKRVAGIRVVRLDGKLVGPLWSLVRLLLFLLVVPALVYDSDVRGLHDRAAGTIVIRT